MIALLPHHQRAHFRLRFFGALARLRELARGAEEHFPFLKGYWEELDVAASPPGGLADAIGEWEAAAPAELPLMALRRAAGLEDDAVDLLFTVGLMHEDARFGMLFEVLQGAPGRRRPAAGLLTGWFRDGGERTGRRALRRLDELGLVEPVDAAVPYSDRELQVPLPVWDALRDDAGERPAAWARHVPAEALPALDDLLLPEPIAHEAAAVPAVVEAGEALTIVVRGPRSNGRRTVLGAVARALGRGVLAIEPPGDHARWRMAGPLATLLGAMPVVAFELAPGEIREIPRLDGYEGAFGVALAPQGGLAGAGAEGAVTLRLPLPGPSERRAHWTAGLGATACEDLDSLAERHRLTAGNVRRAARLARAEAALAGRTAVTSPDVGKALRTLHGQALDALATRVDGGGCWDRLAVAPQTAGELRLLETRCRNRERIGDSAAPALAGQLNPGVRALFTGPSGTGKTLAAQVLAAELGVDLYRLDLSTVVNKYIGETEKNLERALSRAEELDAALLLDEGDALLTQRTGVTTATDRYANLETNYLLQRLESFEGILIVTTNAGDRIDSAFERRMDVVVAFRPPDTVERWAIWDLHLPDGHAVGENLLEEVASLCELTGGQIRNAVLHAMLLGLDEQAPVGSAHLTEGVRREYRKAGQICPLALPGEAVHA